MKWVAKKTNAWKIEMENGNDFQSDIFGFEMWSHMFKLPYLCILR